MVPAAERWRSGAFLVLAIDAPGLPASKDGSATLCEATRFTAQDVADRLPPRLSEYSSAEMVPERSQGEVVMVWGDAFEGRSGLRYGSRTTTRSAGSKAAEPGDPLDVPAVEMLVAAQIAESADSRRCYPSCHGMRLESLRQVSRRGGGAVICEPQSAVAHDHGQKWIWRCIGGGAERLRSATVARPAQVGAQAFEDRGRCRPLQRTISVGDAAGLEGGQPSGKSSYLGGVIDRSSSAFCAVEACKSMILRTAPPYPRVSSIADGGAAGGLNSGPLRHRDLDGHSRSSRLRAAGRPLVRRKKPCVWSQMLRVRGRENLPQTSAAHRNVCAGVERGRHASDACPVF